MGLKEPRERSSKLIGIMRCRKVRMGHSKTKVMKQESKGLVESPWECRVRKLAKDAQGKQMGQGCPRRKKWDKRAHK